MRKYVRHMEEFILNSLGIPEPIHPIIYYIIGFVMLCMIRRIVKKKGLNPTIIDIAMIIMIVAIVIFIVIAIFVMKK